MSFHHLPLELSKALAGVDDEMPMALAALNGVFVVLFDGPTGSVVFEAKGKILAVVEITDDRFTVRLPECEPDTGGDDG